VSDLIARILHFETLSAIPASTVYRAEMPMDPLSDVLSLLESRSYAAGGFPLGTELAVRFPAYEGIKCYAVASGECWLSVDGLPEPFLLQAADCVLLPRGRPFRLATDLSLPSIDAKELRRTRLMTGGPPPHEAPGPYLVGGYFHLAGHQAEFLLDVLPPVVHVRDEAQKATMRWSLERLRDELATPQPGGALIAQQLAYTMLIQALRLHLVDPAFRGVGWLFALADKQMNAAIACVHADPAHPWTVQELAARAGMSRSVFALRFKETVGSTPMEYLTRWRMLKASQRLETSRESISEIALSLGYESASAFRRAFRGVMGCSPREYGARGARRGPNGAGGEPGRDDRGDRPDAAA
jgi:AraC-like DNA-binding protein